MLLQFIIRYMKAIWIALMLGCMGGWITLLIQGFNRYDMDDATGAIFCWISSLIIIVIGIWAFRQAVKIGRKEDEINIPTIQIIAPTNFPKRKGNMWRTFTNRFLRRK